MWLEWDLDRIQAFIEEQFLISFDEGLSADADLFKEGVMDSFGYVQMCRFIEREYGFRFTQSEMTGSVMVSLNQVRAFVARKTGQAV